MRWRAALVLVLGVLTACDRDTLPPEITIEHVVAELAPPLAPWAVVEEPATGTVRRALLQPGEVSTPGAPREAQIAPVPTRLRFHVDVPPDAVVRFGVGVEGEKRRDPALGGVEFRVTVEGREVFTQELNPAATRRDRRWVDGRVDLRPWAGHAVDLVFETRAADPDRPPAGKAGWSHVRLLREAQHPRQGAGSGPNLLLLLVDTLRADRLGIYGAKPSPSPTLDGFASRGLVFDVAIAQASWTMPAVASVFSGLHPRSHGAVGRDVHYADHAGGGTLLPDRVTTLAELAQDAGLTTFGVSTNGLVSRTSNLAQGFETFVQLPFDTKQQNFAAASVVNQRFLAWLRGARGVRFLAYLHYMEPHAPYAPPPHMRPPVPAGIRAELAAGHVGRFALAFDAGRIPAPSPMEIAYLRQLYDGEIRSWDDELAPLLAALERDGLLDHTLVVVMADHGEEFLEHGHLRHGTHLYEESVHIPLVIVGPGVPSGRRADMAQQIDLLPTVAGLLGLAAPPGLPGRDLLATQAAGDAISEIVWSFGGDGGADGPVALRTGRWKLIRSPAASGVELFDLASDPGEHINLAGTTAETAALAARLDRWSAAAPKPPPTTASDPTLSDKLRRLGYIE